MKMTEHFSREEFDCKDGTFYPEKWIKPRLLTLCKALEKIRAVIVQPIKIVSGYRTPEYNHKVRGARFSRHMEGDAVDISVKNIKEVYKLMDAMMNDKQIPQGGLGLYSSWIHYDQRGNKARWKG